VTGLKNDSAAYGLKRGTNKIQAVFTELLWATDEACSNRFGKRLLAAYVAGSVASGEAYPGASDLDWFAFIDAEPLPADRAWRRRKEARLAARFPVVSQVHLNVIPLARLERESFWRFILRYNAARVRGADLVKRLELEGIRTPRPDAALARLRLPFVRKCLTEAMAGRQVPALAQLPRDDALAIRKLARNFVLVEGAHLLMAFRTFKSFSRADVLRGLSKAAPQWRDVYELADRVLDDPYSVVIGRHEFMKELRPFVEWLINTIEKS